MYLLRPNARPRAVRKPPGRPREKPGSRRKTSRNRAENAENGVNADIGVENRASVGENTMGSARGRAPEENADNGVSAAIGKAKGGRQMAEHRADRARVENAGGADESALEQRLRQAVELAESGDFDSADAELRAAIERYPDSPLPHHDLSVLRLTQLRRDYEHLEVWEDLSGDEALFEEAVREAEAALELDAEFLPARNNLAMLFALRGWWKDALEQWETSLSVDPGQSQVREHMVEARKHLD